MKASLLKLILILVVVVCVRAKGIEPGTKTGNEEKSGATITENPSSNLNPGGLALIKLKEEIPELIKNISRHDWRSAPPANQSPGLGIGTLYNTLLGGVHSLYQDLLNRQQAFINLLTCGNCVNDGWEAIMDVALTVPELEWIQNPSDKRPATFFTAIHQNGTVTGIGGSVINGKPVAEYAFGNDGIAHHLPQKH